MFVFQVRQPGDEGPETDSQESEFFGTVSNESMGIICSKTFFKKENKGKGFERTFFQRGVAEP